MRIAAGRNAQGQGVDERADQGLEFWPVPPPTGVPTTMSSLPL